MPTRTLHSPRRTAVLAVTLVAIVAFGLSPLAANEDSDDLLGACTAAQLSEAPHDAWYTESYDAYEPKAEVLESLRGADWDGVDLVLFFGTWCGDSRREVPRMLKLLDAAGVPETARRLIALGDTGDLYKRSPGGEEEGFEIFRVPTLVVQRDGQEIGRIVESPAQSLERDLLAILEGRSVEPSYASYPVLRGWLAEGLLADPNVGAAGLANKVRPKVSSPGELNAAASVLLTRGDVAGAVKLYEVNRVLYPDLAWVHRRLAEAQIRAGDLEEARRSAVRALERNDDPDAIETLVDLIDRTAPHLALADTAEASTGG